jgi:hypothetical protein
MVTAPTLMFTVIVPHPVPAHPVINGMETVTTPLFPGREL